MEKLNLSLFKFILIFFLTLSNLAFSETKIISYDAIEVGVTDGDSLRFGKERIRLFGIDAPEIKQICNDKFKKPYACGEEAKKNLDEFILSASAAKKKSTAITLKEINIIEFWVNVFGEKLKK